MTFEQYQSLARQVAWVTKENVLLGIRPHTDTMFISCGIYEYDVSSLEDFRSICDRITRDIATEAAKHRQIADDLTKKLEGLSETDQV